MEGERAKDSEGSVEKGLNNGIKEGRRRTIIVLLKTNWVMGIHIILHLVLKLYDCKAPNLYTIF